MNFIRTRRLTVACAVIAGLGAGGLTGVANAGTDVDSLKAKTERFLELVQKLVDEGKVTTTLTKEQLKKDVNTVVKDGVTFKELKEELKKVFNEKNGISFGESLKIAKAAKEAYFDD